MNPESVLDTEENACSSIMSSSMEWPSQEEDSNSFVEENSLKSKANYR